MKNKIIIGATGLVLAVTLSFSFIQSNDFAESEHKLAHAEDKKPDSSATAQGSGKADEKTEKDTDKATGKNENADKKEEGSNSSTHGMCTDGERNVPYNSNKYNVEWDKNWNGYSCDAADIAGSRKIVKPISQSINDGENRSNVIYSDEYLAKIAVAVRVPTYDNEYMVSSHLKKEKKQIEVGEAIPLNLEEPMMFENLEGKTQFEDLEAVENMSNASDSDVNSNNE